MCCVCDGRCDVFVTAVFLTCRLGVGSFDCRKSASRFYVNSPRNMNKETYVNIVIVLLFAGIIAFIWCLYDVTLSAMKVK